MLTVVRGAVSKEKRRFKENGFDLDLSYMGVNDRIIAMGFPSESMEAAFRNPMKEVLRFLDSRHKDHYKVYNLCSERGYDAEKFYNRVGLYPFDDHNTPPYEMIREFCEDVQTWLNQDELNIAVIHCKAGKGRTGLMICAWLLFSRMWPNPDQALSYYASMRTHNQKGVTIPSQLRYVRYFHEGLDLAYAPRPLLLTKIIFHTLPKSGSLSDVDFSVHVGKAQVFSYKQYVDSNKLKDEPKVHRVDSKKKKDKKKDKEATNGEQQNGGEEEQQQEKAEFECGLNGVPVCGDVKMEFEKKGEKMFAFWFNTFFVKELKLVIDKIGLDKAHKDVKHHKSYYEGFKVELVFAEMTNTTPRKLTTVSSSPSISSISSSSPSSVSSSNSPSAPAPSSPSTKKEGLASSSSV